jgi:hypothetical protein
VQRPVAGAIGCGDLNISASHSAASTRLVEADHPKRIIDVLVTNELAGLGLLEPEHAAA